MRTNPLFEIFEIYILSLSIILKLFLIFGQSEPNDSYKKDSYKKALDTFLIKNMLNKILKCSMAT